jgi:hypothetical protein
MLLRLPLKKRLNSFIPLPFIFMKPSTRRKSVKAPLFTKREVFALRITCAILSNTSSRTWWSRIKAGFTGVAMFPFAAKAAVDQADRLILELKKPDSDDQTTV